MKNFVEGLLEANEKSRKFLLELDETEKLLGGNQAGIGISRAITKQLIAETERAIGSGDVLQMLAAAKMHGLGEDPAPPAAEEGM